MLYTQQNWKNGDVITADKLNHMEYGIAGDLPHTTELLFEGDLTWDNELNAYIIPIQLEDRIPLVLEAEFSWHGSPIEAGYDVGTSWCHHDCYLVFDNTFYSWYGGVTINYALNSQEEKIMYIETPANNEEGVHLKLNGKFYNDLEVPFYEEEEYGEWLVHLPSNNMFYSPHSESFMSIIECCAFIISTEIPDDPNSTGRLTAMCREGVYWYPNSATIYQGNLISVA